MKKFEIGKTYYTQHACNSDCIIRAKCVKRTASTVTMVTGMYGERTYRIMRESERFFHAEAIRPYGSYSMAPIIDANRECA